MNALAILSIGFLMILRILSALLLLIVATGALRAQEDAAPKLDVAEFIRSLSKPAEPLVLEPVLALKEPNRTRPHLACFSADGKRVAAVYGKYLICIWDTKTGERVSPVNYRCPGVITALALSSDGKYVLIGREGHNGLLGASDEIKVVNIYKGFTSGVTSAVISPDDKFAVFCEKSGIIHRFPLLEGEGKAWPKDEHDTEEYRMWHVMPDARYVLVGGHSQKRLRMVDLEAEGEAPKSFAFDVDYGPFHAVLAKKHIIYSDSGKLYFRSRPDQLEGYIQVSSASLGGWLRMSADERRLVLLNNQGYGEVRDMIAPGVEKRFFIGHPATTFALAPDGRTMALGVEDGTLHLKRLPETVDPPGLLASRTLQQLLAAKDYEGLEAIFLHYEREMKPFAWAPNQTPYNELCSLLAYPPGSPLKFEKIAAAIETWRDDRPLAVAPKLLLAQQHISEAWQARGGGTADTVTLKGWAGFRREIKLAEAIIVPICDQDAPPPHAFSQLFTIAMAQQWSEKRRQPYVDKLVRVAPHCLDGHFALAMILMPRWGGAPEDLANYAGRVADGIGGEAGDGVYARFALAQHFLYPGPRIFQDSGLSYDRTRRGLEYLAKHAPDKEHAMCFGAWFAVQQTDNEGLIAFCELLKDKDVTLIWPAALHRYEGDYRTITQQLKAVRLGEAAMP